MQDNNYEKFTYAIELEIEIRDFKLQYNEYQLDNIMMDLLDAKASENFNKLMDERFDFLQNLDDNNIMVTTNADEIANLTQQYNRGQNTLTAL